MALGIWPVARFLEIGWFVFLLIPCVINIIEIGFHRANIIVLGIVLAVPFAQWIPTIRELTVSYVLLLVGFVLLVYPNERKDS